MTPRPVSHRVAPKGLHFPQAQQQFQEPCLCLSQDQTQGHTNHSRGCHCPWSLLPSTPVFGSVGGSLVGRPKSGPGSVETDQSWQTDHGMPSRSPSRHSDLLAGLLQDHVSMTQDGSFLSPGMSSGPLPPLRATGCGLDVSVQPPKHDSSDAPRERAAREPGTVPGSYLYSNSGK